MMSLILVVIFYFYLKYIFIKISVLDIVVRGRIKPS